MVCIVQHAHSICRYFQKQKESTQEDGRAVYRGFLPVFPVMGIREVRDERRCGHSVVCLGHRE